MPRAENDFTAIYTTERVSISFDFADGMNIATITGEVVESIIDVSAIVVSGVDATPSDRLIGNAAIIGTSVSQQVGTLQEGVIYNFICVVLTSANQKLSTNAHLACHALT